MTNPHEFCASQLNKSGSSFYYSFLFLNYKQRRAINAVYCFCRAIDDVVDEITDKSVAAQTLSWWHDECERIYKGNPMHPIGHALVDVLNDYKLPQRYFKELLQGMLYDLQDYEYHDFSDLNNYCYNVASTVGILSSMIFGFKDHKTLDFARELGVALQLVNIIRDLGEDLRRGRIYLPLSELEQFSCSKEELLSLRITNQKQFKELLSFQAKRARVIYQNALTLLPETDRRSQKPALIMAKIYFTILDEIENNGFTVLQEKTSLTPIRKLMIACFAA